MDQVIALDAEWRAVRYELDSHQKDLNSISKEVGQIKKVCMHGHMGAITLPWSHVCALSHPWWLRECRAMQYAWRRSLAAKQWCHWNAWMYC